MPQHTQLVTVRLPTKLVENIDDLAEREAVTRTHIVVEALWQYFDNDGEALNPRNVAAELAMHLPDADDLASAMMIDADEIAAALLDRLKQRGVLTGASAPLELAAGEDDEEDAG